MKRRRLLAALSAGLAGLAGCQGLDGGGRRTTFGVPPAGTDREDPPAGSGATTPPTTPPPGVEVVEDPTPPGDLRRTVATAVGPERRLVLSAPALLGLPTFSRLTAGFVRPPTPEAPARVWIAFTNVGEARRTYAFGPSPPYSNYVASGRTAGGSGPAADGTSPAALLVPDDGRPFPHPDPVPEAPTDEGWVATRGLGRVAVENEHRIALDPGESIAGTYVLLAAPGADPRPERGAYRFDPEFESVGFGLAAFDPALAVPRSSRFPADLTPPGLPGSDRTRWFHRIAGRRTSPGAFVRPDRERLRIDGDRVTLSLENYSLETVRDTGWVLYKLHDGAWKRIVPWRVSLGLSLVPPGATSKVTLVPRSTVPRSTVPPEGSPERRDGSGHVVGGLGPGTYAVRVGSADADPPAPDSPVVVGNPEGYLGGGSPSTPPTTATSPAPTTTTITTPTSTTATATATTTTAASDPTVTVVAPDGRGSVALAALLRLEGDPIAVTYTDDVRRVERDGETATVVTADRLEDDTERPHLVAHRLGEPPSDATSLVTEQVLQFPALRNALTALATGVETVRVVTDPLHAVTPVERLGRGNGRLAFVHEGTAATAAVETAVEVSDGD